MRKKVFFKNYFFIVKDYICTLDCGASYHLTPPSLRDTVLGNHEKNGGGANKFIFKSTVKIQVTVFYAGGCHLWIWIWTPSTQHRVALPSSYLPDRRYERQPWR